jgi:hypothetical protein
LYNYRVEQYATQTVENMSPNQVPNFVFGFFHHQNYSRFFGEIVLETSQNYKIFEILWIKTYDQYDLWLYNYIESTSDREVRTAGQSLSNDQGEESR